MQATSMAMYTTMSSKPFHRVFEGEGGEGSRKGRKSGGVTVYRHMLRNSLHVPRYPDFWNHLSLQTVNAAHPSIPFFLVPLPFFPFDSLPASRPTCTEEATPSRRAASNCIMFTISPTVEAWKGKEKRQNAWSFQSLSPTHIVASSHRPSLVNPFLHPLLT